jgi:hypothetical protein
LLRFARNDRAKRRVCGVRADVPHGVERMIVYLLQTLKRRDLRRGQTIGARCSRDNRRWLSARWRAASGNRANENDNRTKHLSRVNHLLLL